MSADSTPTRLVLVRHGEAQTHVDQVIGGHNACSGLSELGRRQAAALRDRLARTGEIEADHLYASILPRAIETAEVIAPAVGRSAGDIVRECDLCESHSGEADGMRWEDWRERYLPEYGDRTPYDPWAPGAESWAEMCVRVGRALHGLARRHRGETVVIACHGGVIEASFSVLAKLPVSREWRTQIQNTSITEWVLRPDDFNPGSGARWTLVRFSDAAHLSDLA